MKKVWALLSSNKIIDFLDLEDLRDGEERLERYTQLFSSSFFVKDVTEDKTVKLNSVWNGTSFESTEDLRKHTTSKNYFALINNNVVKGIIKTHTVSRANLYKAAEVDGISVVDVTEMAYADLKIGMTWDGTSFTE